MNASTFVQKLLNGLNTTNGRYRIYYIDNENNEVELTQKFGIISHNFNVATEFSTMPMEATLPKTENAIVGTYNLSVKLVSLGNKSLLEQFFALESTINNVKNIGNNLLGTDFKTDEIMVDSFQTIENIHQKVYQLYVVTPYKVYDNLYIKSFGIANEITVENSMRYWDFDIQFHQANNLSFDINFSRQIAKLQKTNIPQTKTGNSLFAQKKTEFTTKETFIKKSYIPAINGNYIPK